MITDSCASDGHQSVVHEAKKPVSNESKPRDSLHSLELSPQMKKKLWDKIKAPEPSTRTTTKPIPWVVESKIKSLLLANKSGIWVSRFLIEFKVSYRESFVSNGWPSVANCKVRPAIWKQEFLWLATDGQPLETRISSAPSSYIKALIPLLILGP